MVYSNEPIGELVSRDTDADGILDWEEGLWGTDPTKKDTDNDGILDDIEISRLKTETVENTSSSQAEKAPLTTTDKFSDELFATVAALGQSGSLDDATVEKISSSLAKNIQQSIPKKVYTIKNIKLTADESKKTIQDYNYKLQALQTKYPLNEDITAIFSESLTPEQEIDVKVLKKFDPVINQLNSIVKEMLSMNPPKSLAVLHVVIINGFQKLSENLSDMKLVDTDTIVAFSAINQYEENATRLGEYINQLIFSINQKLNN